jgi:DNA invertase Pin-like site-specific DNA recombinase
MQPESGNSSTERVFGYVRCSTTAQLDKDGPVRQVEAIKAFCDRHKLQLLTVYEDGISGAELDRPQFHEMLVAAKEVGVTGIVLEKQDRLARDLIVQETLLARVSQAGLKVYFSDQGLYDAVSAENDPTRKLIRQILGAVSEFDRKNIRMRLYAGLKRAAQLRGYWTPRGFGYTEPERLTLTRIYELWLAGNNYREISDILNEEGFHALPNGSTKWTPSAVRRCVVVPTRWGLVDLGRDVMEAQMTDKIFGGVYAAEVVAVEWNCETGEQKRHVLPQELGAEFPQPWELAGKAPKDMLFSLPTWRKALKEEVVKLYEEELEEQEIAS